MATISNTPRPGYVWDSTDNVWYPIGVGGHSHPDYITQATAVNPTIIDAKGDIITATAADTPARLAVGNNGETLVADSSTSTGLRYTSGTVQSNPVLNSAMQVWQRGTSMAGSTTAFCADRWQAYRAVAGSTFSRQTTGDTTNLPNIQYCLRVARDSGNTSTSTIYTGQSFESINSIPFAGKTITFSFYARKGANYSPTSSGLDIYLQSGTGTDQNIVSTGYTGAVNVVAQTATLTTTWQRFTYTGTVAATATELGFNFNMVPTGTAGAADYYEITGVQIDIGSVALPFRTYAATIQGELAACQRYYFRNTGALMYYGSGGIAGSTTQCYVQVKHPTTMRVAPTSLDYSLLLLQIISGSTNVTSASISKAQEDLTLILANTASGLTATTQSYMLMSQNNAAAYLGLSAEL